MKEKSHPTKLTKYMYIFTFDVDLHVHVDVYTTQKHTDHTKEAGHVL